MKQKVGQCQFFQAERLCQPNKKKKAKVQTQKKDKRKSITMFEIDGQKQAVKVNVNCTKADIRKPCIPP